jgi:undecaprenyl diphosphate synthase
MASQPQSHAKTLRDLTLTYSPEERQILESLDFARIPRHVAVIMDGNGRWARRQARERVFGHEVARGTVRMAVETCRDVGVGWLTLYAFSSENWKRPMSEVNALMRLLALSLAEEREDLHRNNVKVRLIGDPGPLPMQVKGELDRTVARTRDNTGMLLSLAINYGGRADVVQACQSLARRVQAGELAPGDITEEMLGACLYTGDAPDPDLLIRTGGDYRISNFLLWQAAYSELLITPTLWPELSRGELLRAIRDFQERERRFGGV